jgi:small subunit ribosomal protein S8
MSMTDPIADFLTRIRNGQAALKNEVTMPSSKLKIAVSNVLKDEGYLEDYSVSDSNGKPILTVKLKYYKGLPVIANLQRVSTPGRRVYKDSRSLPQVLGGLGVAVISTSKGVMSGKLAEKGGHGGEVLLLVS